MLRVSRLFWLLTVLLTLAGIVPHATAADDERHILVLGRISDDPKTHYEQLKPLLDYVVPRMADVGIREGRVLMARDAQQMASYLRRGQVDWVTETAGSAMLLQQRGNAQPLLLTERDGVSRYRTVFFVRRDSGLKGLEDLRGRSVAFQNNASTSAYFVPAIELLRRKLSLSLLLSPMDKPSDRTVGYVFARSELNIGAWVHKRLVDAGTLSDIDWNNPARLPPSFRKDLEVIYTSEPVPRALEMVRSDLDPKVQARLREVLIEAAGDPRAREALQYFFRTTRFMPVDDEARRVLERLRIGVSQVRADVE
jgi:phosphonate transport system substrate-binding protein